MKAEAFFNLVEIRTKAASVLTYAAGTLYAIYKFDAFKGLHAALLLVSLLCLDLAGAALKNFLAMRTEHSMFYLAGITYSKSTVKRLILVLFILASLSGGYLAYLTGPLVWLMGVLGFLCAILYSAGPLPIQRTMLGELCGLFMGFGILFLACFVHLDGSAFQLYTFGDRLRTDISLSHLRSLLLLGLPLATAITNVHLANTISQMDKDLAQRRFTLAVSLGRDNALILYMVHYLLGLLAVLLAVIFQSLPLSGLLLVLVYGLVLPNARRFAKAPNKMKAFPLSLINFNLIAGALILVIGSGLLFNI